MSMNLCANAFWNTDLAVHDRGMEPVIPKLLRALMDKMGLNQTELAKRLGHGVTQPQISKWLRGSTPEHPNYMLIMALAEAQGLINDVRSEDVAAELYAPPPPRKVKIKGYVGASSEAHFYALADEDFEEAIAPEGATERTVAVEIKGTSLGTFFNSWLVFYDDVRSPVTEDLYGRVCVVGLADDRVLVKRLVRTAKGTFTLKSNSSEADIEDVQIEWAARVTEMRQRI